MDPNHDQLAASNEYILAVSLHGPDHFAGTGGRWNTLIQTRVHFPVFLPVLQQRMVGDIGPHASRTENGNPDAPVFVLGPEAFVKSKEGMLGSSISAP